MLRLIIVWNSVNVTVEDSLLFLLIQSLEVRIGEILNPHFWCSLITNKLVVIILSLFRSHIFWLNCNLHPTTLLLRAKMCIGRLLLDHHRKLCLQTLLRQISSWWDWFIQALRRFPVSSIPRFSTTKLNLRAWCYLAKDLLALWIPRENLWYGVQFCLWRSGHTLLLECLRTEDKVWLINSFMLTCLLSSCAIC